MWQSLTTDQQTQLVLALIAGVVAMGTQFGLTKFSWFSRLVSTDTARRKVIASGIVAIVAASIVAAATGNWGSLLAQVVSTWVAGQAAYGLAKGVSG